MGRTTRATDSDDSAAQDGTRCPACGSRRVPRLTAAAEPVVAGGPLSAEVPVRLACPSCD